MSGVLCSDANQWTVEFIERKYDSIRHIKDKVKLARQDLAELRKVDSFEGAVTEQREKVKRALRRILDRYDA